MSSPLLTHVVINLYQSCNEDSSKTFGRDNYRILYKVEVKIYNQNVPLSVCSKGHFLGP